MLICKEGLSKEVYEEAIYSFEEQKSQTTLFRMLLAGVLCPPVVIEKESQSLRPAHNKTHTKITIEKPWTKRVCLL